MSAFTVKKRVEFHQTDMAGIVHFSEFFRYFESAEHAMFRSLGLSVHEKGSDVGWPRVSCRFDYAQPLYFEDEFDLQIVVQRIGECSLTLACEITRGETLIAKGESTSVRCRKTEEGRMKKSPIPDSVRSKLEGFLS